VCLFELLLKKEWFTTYEKDGTKDVTTVGIVTQTLYSILSSGTAGHNIVLYYEGDPDSLNIDLESSEPKSFGLSFKIPTVNCEYDLLSIPEVECDAEFIVNAKQMADIFSKLSLFGDIIQFQCNEEKIAISTNGENGEMMVNMKVDELKEYAVCEGEEIDLSYSLSYLSKMCVTTKLTEDIEISLCKESPLRIAYHLGEGCMLYFYLAPKALD